MFGDKGQDEKHHPFHLYPMRQAIEEGFIEDVLTNYLTYSRYYHLEKTLLDDPKYETAKARAALARFVTLYPENLAQKAEIVIEHFRDKIAHRMKGKAKAMVVCSSRPHAVRMWEALRKYINNNGYDIGVLVAFSGEVEGLTETKANGFPESQTVTQFDTDEYRIIVVAEKFQTGFDQPRLVAMYVDKTLSGLNASGKEPPPAPSPSPTKKTEQESSPPAGERRANAPSFSSSADLVAAPPDATTHAQLARRVISLLISCGRSRSSRKSSNGSSRSP